MIATILAVLLAAEQPTPAEAGALLAANQLQDAESAARACRDPACSLTLARALALQGRHGEAAAAAMLARLVGGDLAAYGAAMQGEALLRDGRAIEAVEPLRVAASLDGPVGVRASASLASALLLAGDLLTAQAQAEKAAARAGQPAETRTAMAWVAAQALAQNADTPEARRLAAQAMRHFWLSHPQHPASETARKRELELDTLPDPAPEELVQRAQRLLGAGKPGAAVAQSHAAAELLSGTAAADAHLVEARALSADGRRADAVPALQDAWLHGSPRVAAAAGLLLARDRARRGRDAEALALAAQLMRKFDGQPEADEAQLFSARLELDAGKTRAAQARLRRLAQGRSSTASAARWMLAWSMYREGAKDAGKRFADVARQGDSDLERAQGLYWQARAGDAGDAAVLFRKVVELDPFGWYGLLARDRLGAGSDSPAPFPRPPPVLPPTMPARLQLAAQLLELGLTGEAAAETDWFVEHSRPDAVVLALPLYARAARYDRAVSFAEPLLGRGQPPRGLLEAAYPMAFPEDVARAARRVRLDPYLVLAVMRRESVFKAEARSAAGAVGLLQLLPATARRAAVVLGRPALRDEQLVQPPIAIDLGAWYLAELVGRFGDPAVAAAAYNAGPRVAAPWAARGVGRPLDEWVEDIPYRETRRYVKVVIGAWAAYRALAGGSPPRLSETVPAPRSGAAF